MAYPERRVTIISPAEIARTALRLLTQPKQAVWKIRATPSRALPRCRLNCWDRRTPVHGVARWRIE
jgi:hypothetical protein